jgi:CheY-like chemotaxis protein
MAVISLFNGSYCHADEIVQAAADGLGYPVITERVLEEASRKFNVPRDQLRSSLNGTRSFLGKLVHDRDKHVAFVRLVLAELIQSDNVIVTGCIAHLIPRTIGHDLRVLAIANHDYRVRQAIEQDNVSEKDASKAIREDDKQNMGCTEYLFGKSCYDESLYDLVLPMHELSVSEATRMVSETAQSEPVQTTERSKAAAHDFVLAAKVSLKLAEEGLSADVHAEGGNVILSINKNVVRLGHYRESLKKVAEQVSGVMSATTRLGPRYKPASANPWSNIEGPPKVMLVDDEKEFVQTLSERLKTRNLESSIAYDGEQALAMADEDAPDVIVLDLMMPGINGIETLRRLKRDHPQVEVIILTGHGSEHERREAEELGAFAYLRKPVDIDHLARVMRQAYARSGGPPTSDSAEPESRE